MIRISNVLYLFIIILGASSVGSHELVAIAAGTMECTIVASAKCDCKAGLMVKCTGHPTANLRNEEKPKQVVLRYQPTKGDIRSFIIKAPAGKVEDYHYPEELPEVQNEMKRLGIKFNSNDNLDATLVLRSSTPLFADTDAKILISGSSSPAPSASAWSYIYGGPRIIDFNGKKTCAAIISCTGKVNTSICPANDPLSCPGADTCLSDETLHQLPDQVLSVFCLGKSGSTLGGCTRSGIEAKVQEKTPSDDKSAPIHQDTNDDKEEPNKTTDAK